MEAIFRDLLQKMRCRMSRGDAPMSSLQAGESLSSDGGGEGISICCP